MNKVTVVLLSSIYDVAMQLNNTEDLDGRDCCQRVFDAAYAASVALFGKAVGEKVDQWVIESSQWDIETLERFALDARKEIEQPAEEIYSTEGRKVKGNNTPFPIFNRIAKHPLVDYVDYEGEDGFWAHLIDGYNWDGCSCVHEWYIEDVEAQLDLVTKGDPS